MQLKFLEIKRFIFQLEEIVEFSKEEAADVATLIKSLEQCLGLKLYLNVDNLDVKKMQDMLTDILSKVKKQLPIDGLEDFNTEDN